MIGTRSRKFRLNCARDLIDVHHRRVQRQHVLFGDPALAGGLTLGNDDLQVVWHVVAVRRQSCKPHAQQRETNAAKSQCEPAGCASSGVLLRHDIPFSVCTKNRIGKTLDALKPSDFSG